MRYIYIICFIFLFALTGQAQTIRTIHVATAGTLPNYISDSEKYTVEELTLTGELNGTDFRLLRDMAGKINNSISEGKLKVLDMSGAKIIAGGEVYVNSYTVDEDNKFPNYVFNDCILTSVNIPNSVTGIGDGAFRSCSDLTSITIPSSVEYIGNGAFYECRSLTSIRIPNGVTYIGSSAFSGCYGLTSISIPNSVTRLGPSALAGCSYLTSVSISNSITRIENNTFYRCGALPSISIPSSVEYIGKSAFTDCESLTYLDIPNGVGIIGESAFSNCRQIVNVIIPKSVQQIGSGAFQNCESLTAIEVDVNNENYSSESGVLFNKDKTILVCCPSGKSGEFIIPNGVSVIGNNSFNGCAQLNTITIPNSVTSINNYAFSGCSSLTSINIPNSVTSIGNYAFCRCGLTSLVIPNSMTTISENAFRDCSGLKTVTIPNSVSSIGNLAFAGCSNISCVIPENQNPFEFVEGAFDAITYSNALLTVPVGTKSQYQATSSWNKFVNVVESGSRLTKRSINVAGAGSLPNYISDTDIYIIEELTLTGNLTGTDFRLLRDMSGNNSKGEITEGKLRMLDISGTKITTSYWDQYLETNIINNNNGNIALSESMHYIRTANELPEYVFAGCEKLSSVILPTSIKSIRESAFEACNGITDITIPNNVTSLGQRAFNGCNSLTSIMIPSELTSIGDGAFGYCSKLTSIEVDANNASFESVSGVLFNEDKTIIFCYPAGKTDSQYTIPNTVSTIGVGSFEGCTKLTSVLIPNSVTAIGENAYMGCGGLTNIVSEIPSPFEIAENVFSESTYTSAKLTVPFGLREKYRETNYWNKFTTIEEKAPEGEVTLLTNGIQYKGDASTLNVGVQSIESNLMEVEIPSSINYNGLTFQVTSVADDAFSNRTFNYVSLPSTVTSINGSTFSGSTLGALIWNADASLSSGVFNNMSNTIDANFLLYVNDQSYAPSNVKNVVVGTTASSIMLADAKNTMFYCPREFTATTISYTHNYSMETGGTGMGWESIALPFDVQKIEHATKGELTPFASYDTNSDQRPFWLYEMGNSGFRRTSTIKANTPYIISMPNNSAYDEEYILSGNVSFSASDATVVPTKTLMTVTAGNKQFVPAFSVIEKNATVYALNVTNDLVSEPGSYVAGSRFVSDLREVYPFEAYMTSTSTSAPYLSIEFDNGTTGLDMIPESADAEKAVTIYSLAGHKILGCKRADFENHWNMLPTGIYIVNGKKRLK